MTLDSTARAWRLWRRFTTKAADDRRLLARAAVVQAILIAGVRVTMATGTAERLARRLGRTTRPVDDVRQAVLASSAVFGAFSTCLSRALTIQAFASDGAAMTLVGVRRDPSGGLAAHAWIERHGAIVAGDAGSHAYLPIARRKGGRWQRS